MNGEVYNTHGPDLLTRGRVQIVLYAALIGERTNCRVTIVLIIRVSRTTTIRCSYWNIWQVHCGKFIQPSLGNGADVRSGPRAWIVTHVIYKGI